MASFIVLLIVIIALLLGIVVLVQAPKGGGLASGFQGAAQIGGVQRTTEFLEKATWYLAIAMFVLCLVSTTWFSTSRSSVSGDAGSPNTESPEGGNATQDGSQSGAQGNQ
jgi:preprotein translocase subunit SecG